MAYGAGRHAFRLAEGGAGQRLRARLATPIGRSILESALANGECYVETGRNRRSGGGKGRFDAMARQTFGIHTIMGRFGLNQVRCSDRLICGCPMIGDAEG